MSEESYTEVTTQSWFSRISGALKGIIFGLLFFLAAFPLLFWNEGRAVKRYKTLQEGAGAVISVTATKVNPKNDGRLVHVVGRADTKAMLQDGDFGVSVNALKLDRRVEMYQWKESTQKETRKKLGGGTETITTYSYDKTWSERPIRSSGFKKPDGHRNPDTMPYASAQKVASNITLEAFKLSPSLAGKINQFSPLPSDTIRLPTAISNEATLSDGEIYFGENSITPQIGDVRVSFRIVAPTTVSIIAGQTGKTFRPYQTKAGGTIELLEIGEHTPDAMIQSAQTHNRILTWGLRLAGFLLMAVSLIMIFRPLAVLADVVPILGGIVETGTGIIAFLIAAVLSLITIAIAWLVYRPLLGILLIAAALLLTWALRSRLKAKSPTPPPPPPPQ